jgi:hypothetical protein
MWIEARRGQNLNVRKRDWLFERFQSKRKYQIRCEPVDCACLVIPVEMIGNCGALLLPDNSGLNR